MNHAIELWKPRLSGVRWSALGALALALGLSGCAGGQAEFDQQVRGKLDAVSGEIVLPLSEYGFYGRHADQQTFAAAAQAVVGECMREQGLEFSVAQVQPDPSTDLDDRRYGIWEETRAARFGWGYAQSPLDAALAQASKNGGPSWVAAYTACNEDNEKVMAKLDEVSPPQDEYLNSLAARLESEAMTSAQKDERWAAARVPWEKCLVEAGLTPEDGEGYISVQSSALLGSGETDNAEEAIRLASIEARCNTDTRLTQKLADIEAQHQQLLIDQNQAALNTEKERKQKLLAAARTYIDAHG